MLVASICCLWAMSRSKSRTKNWIKSKHPLTTVLAYCRNKESYVASTLTNNHLSTMWCIYSCVDKNNIHQQWGWYALRLTVLGEDVAKVCGATHVPWLLQQCPGAVASIQDVVVIVQVNWVVPPWPPWREQRQWWPKMMDGQEEMTKP